MRQKVEYLLAHLKGLMLAVLFQLFDSYVFELNHGPVT